MDIIQFYHLKMKKKKIIIKKKIKNQIKILK